MTPLYHSDQPLPKTSGIYRITCTVTGKFYIGSSTDLQHRWAQHLYSFRNNIHGNPHMQNAWNKHGEQCFVFEVLELTLPAFQLEREQYWLDKLKPFGKKGFNINRDANKPSFSPETRERIRLAKLGYTFSPEARLKMSMAQRGKPSPKRGTKLSPETRAKISASKLGRPAHNKGKPHSEEARAKLSNANASQMKTIIVTSPDGTEYVVTGVRKFCREHNLHIGHLMDVANGNQKHHKKWKARYPEQ